MKKQKKFTIAGLATILSIPLFLFIALNPLSNLLCARVDYFESVCLSAAQPQAAAIITLPLLVLGAVLLLLGSYPKSK